MKCIKIMLELILCACTMTQSQVTRQNDGSMNKLKYNIFSREYDLRTPMYYVYLYVYT